MTRVGYLADYSGEQEGDKHEPESCCARDRDPVGRGCLVPRRVAISGEQERRTRNETLTTTDRTADRGRMDGRATQGAGTLSSGREDLQCDWHPGPALGGHAEVSSLGLSRHGRDLDLVAPGAGAVDFADRLALPVGIRMGTACTVR